MNVDQQTPIAAGEARMIERMLIVDAVCEAIAEFGQAAFARSLVEREEVAA